MLYAISKEMTKSLLKRAQSEWEVYAPVKGHDKDVALERLTQENEVTFDYLRLPLGTKSVLYPQSDPMFVYTQEKITPVISSSKKLLFGLRSCDVKGLQYTDNFFSKNFEDIYYLSKRANLTLISIACNTPDSNCFCTSTKTGPYLEKGFDLQFTDAGDMFLVEIGSERGERLRSAFAGFFKKVDGKELECKKKIHEKAIEKFPIFLLLNMEKAVQILKTNVIKDDFWQKWANQCIYCGGCSYVCCTCTCFTVVDRGVSLRGIFTEGIRYRCWDSCQFSGYTREASQHNPRSKDCHRMARWFEHKLKYDVIANGTYSCMGCGRCVSVCPGFIGMINVVADICAKGEAK
jgi:ferredoxin